MMFKYKSVLHSKIYITRESQTRKRACALHQSLPRRVFMTEPYIGSRAEGFFGRTGEDTFFRSPPLILPTKIAHSFLSAAHFPMTIVKPSEICPKERATMFHG